MTTKIANISLINSNTIMGKISVSPQIPNKIYFLPTIDYTNCCITLCDSYNDYSSFQHECAKTEVNKRNYFFYGTNGTCVAKLTNNRKNNMFGTIRPKNIQWKFLNDVKIKRIEGYKSFIVFNKYPGLLELKDEENKKQFMREDFKNVKDSNSDIDDIICFVSKNIIDVVVNYDIDFPFKKYFVIEDISHSIELLFGKVVSSGDPFHHGFIKCTTEDGANNILHADYNDKNKMEFQALRGGLVEFSTSKTVSDGEFVIFCEHPVNKLYLDDVEIEFSKDLNILNDTVANITTTLIDSEKLKYNGENFVSDVKNAMKIQYYKFTSIDKIVPTVDFTTTEFNNIIKNVGYLSVKSVRTNLNVLEDDKKLNFSYSQSPPALGRQISDGGYIGQMISCAYDNY